jgi:MFS family permease
VLATVWAAAMIVFSWWTMPFHTWRWLMVLGIGLPLMIGAVGIYVFFVESPRWLNSRGKFDECRKVLRFVSTYNRRKPFEFNFAEEMELYNS